MKEKFIASRHRNLPEILSQDKQQIERAYNGQRPLAAILANSEASWIIKEISPGHSILLHNESIARSENHLERIQNENCLILIEEIFSQFEVGRQKLEAFKSKTAYLTDAFAMIKRHFAENSEKLMAADAIAIIHLTLVQNCIKEIEQLLLDLDSVLKADNATVNSHQEAINICCALFFDPSFKVTDSTLHKKLQSENKIGEGFKSDISKFKEALSKKKNLLMQAKPDSLVLNKISPQYADILEHIEGLYEITDIFDQDDDRIRLHQVSNLGGYVKIIILALKNKENFDLLDKSINYRQERLDAINALIDQMTLSLALNESSEKIALLYRWIEICRGKSPKERLFNKELFDSKSLISIHQDPVLNEIYFKLPRILQADLSSEAEQRAQETNITDSARSIDDSNLDPEQVLLRWTKFISQAELCEPKLIPNFSVCSAPLVLMGALNAEIANSQDKGDPKIIALWKRQLKAAYKLYQVTLDIPSEKRLLTQEPLTEEEYQLIQNDPIFSSIFRSLSEIVQERLRQEYYKSSVLHVLAGQADQGAPINPQGLLEHDKGSEADYILKGGETEFTRGFRFLIEGDFLQYKLKFESKDGLVNILVNKGFTQSEANSIVGFIREQKVYYIFLNFLASRAYAITKKVYTVKELPEYVNIYKSNGKVYFEVTSGPWSFMCIDDELFFPDQRIENAKKKRGNIENFYDAEFKLRYELILGEKITQDVLQLIDVTTDTQASWQLLNFDSSEWRTLTTIKRYITDIDKAMIALSNSDPKKRLEAKMKIEEWLCDEKHFLDLEDYKLIQMHLGAISKVSILSRAIGCDWLEGNLYRCSGKIKEKNASLAEPKKQEPLLLESSPPDSFDVQMMFSDLICQKPDKVAQAKCRVERFLGSDPSFAQCKELKEFLSPLFEQMILKDSISLLNKNVVSDPEEKEQGLSDRDWLQTQIRVCDSHIAAAQDDAVDVSVVVSQLMDKQSREGAVKDINTFLQASTQDLSKRVELGRLLTIYNDALQKKDSEDPTFIQWLNNAIGAAKSALPESKAKLSTSSLLLLDFISKIKKETPAVPSSSSSSSSSVPSFFANTLYRLSGGNIKPTNGKTPPSPPH